MGKRQIAATLAFAEALLVSSLFSACVFYRPNTGEFVHIDSIRDLEGVYKNLGEHEDKSGIGPYLSNIIWPNAANLSPDTIATIEVKAVSANTLSVKARRQNGQIAKESTFVAGKDFDLTNGHIVLHRKIELGRGPGDPLVGPSYESVELGLDDKGQGRYQQNSAAAGLIFLIVPVAFAGSEGVRFERVSEPERSGR